MRRWAGAAVPLLVFVLLFRMLVPAGYMIGPDDAGRPGLVLCSVAVDSAARHAMSHGHGDHPAAPAKSQGPSCPYAALAAPPLPPAAPVVVPPAPAPAPIGDSVPTIGARRLALAAPPPPATGPPSPV